MPDCPDCTALKAKLSLTERKRDVVTRLAKKTPAPEPDAVEKMATNVQAADEAYALAKAEAEYHEWLTGHKVFDAR